MSLKINVEIAGANWFVDTSGPVELAIALDFSGAQARAFGLPRARSGAFEAGEFVGDRRRGGSANCETLELTPHGNGTHTEGVGHITAERISVSTIVIEPLLPASILTIPLRSLGATSETYDGDFDDGDQVLCCADLEQAREQIELEDVFLTAIVVRIETDSRPFEVLTDHSGTNPPYLTKEAVEWMRHVGCEHLLVELPSVDRESDGGTLPNHHRFFGLRRGADADAESRKRTITEMIDVPRSVTDGRYMLSLRFPRFKLDATPSRPIIYPVHKDI